VCASEDEAKNLAAVAKHKKRAAGASEHKPKPDTATVKGKIVEFGVWMLKQGYAESTVKMRIHIIKTLAKREANIFDPESVKEVISKQKTWSNGRKSIVVDAYTCFLRMLGRKWDPPRYKPVETLPFIPTEQELDALIAGCSKRISAFLQGLKETGANPGELWHLKWSDIDKERKVVTINAPHKGHNPRILPISSKFIAMVERLPKNSEYVFMTTPRIPSNNFAHQRKRIAQKLQNPRINKITLRTFRHWKATMEYHKTRDPWHVKRLLGHKTLKSTEVYINIEQAIFKETNDEFTVKVAKTPEEIKALLEVGFEYVCQKDGLTFFRKRK
jgi:integrase